MFQQLDQTKLKRYLYISFYEVYNDKVYDTFNKIPGKTNNALNIIEDKNGFIDIPDLIRLRITSCSEAFNYIFKALKVLLIKTVE